MKIDEKTGLYGNYGIWHKPFWQTTTFYWLISGFVGLIFIILCYVLIKKYRVYRKKKLLPVWKRSLQELELLWKTSPMKPELGKKFYFLLTYTIKAYLEEQLHVQFCSKTDAEVISYLEKREDINNELLHTVRDVFKGSELVKFANELIIQDQINHDYKQTVAFLEKIEQKQKSN